MKWLTVIIPVYNVRAYLRECLESVSASAKVLASRGWGVEIICVDDGSDDGSEEIVRLFECSDCSIEVKRLTQEHQGVSAARNRGIEAAKGEWITFVDGDDRIGEGRLARFAELAEETGADVVRLGWRDWKESGEVRRPLPAAERVDWESVTRDGCVWSMCYRREAIGETRFVEGLGFSEDTVFNLNVLTKPGLKFVQREDDDYWYRWREGSACRRMIGSRDWAVIAGEVSGFRFQGGFRFQRFQRFQGVQGVQGGFRLQGGCRLQGEPGEFWWAVSRWMLTHLIWWIAEGTEREREGELREKLGEMRRAGKIRIGAMKAKYRWAMWLWIRWGWRAPMMVMTLAVKAERWRRGLK